MARSLLFLRFERASVLVTVIWVLVFFAVLSAGIARVVASQAGLLRKVEGWVLGEYAMRSACRHIQKELQAREEPFCSMAYLRLEREAGFGTAMVRYHFVDEESRINVNTAPQEVLARLPGINANLAGKIKASAFQPFIVKEALFWVEEFDRAAFDASRDFVTVYSTGRVNVNTASREVLEAAGLEASLAAAIDDLRKGSDGARGTDDDMVFKDAALAVEALNEEMHLSLPQKNLLTELFNSGGIGVNSWNFTVRASVYVRGKKAGDYEVVLNAGKLLRWQEY